MSHFGRSGPPDIRDTYSLLALNITFRTSADDLFPLFDRYGKVVDVFIPRDRRTGDSRGFTFVRYKYADEAQKAIDRLDGRIVDGRSIMVQFAKYGPNAERIERGRVSYSGSRSPRRSRPRDEYYRDSRDYRDHHKCSRSRDRYERDRDRDYDRNLKVLHRGSHSQSRSRSISPSPRDSRARNPVWEVSRSRSRSDENRQRCSSYDRKEQSPNERDIGTSGHSPSPRRSPSPCRASSRSPLSHGSVSPLPHVRKRSADERNMSPSRSPEWASPSPSRRSDD